MKIYILIYSLIFSNIIFAFGENISIEKFTENEISQTINSVSQLIIGENPDFKLINNSKCWYEYKNLKMKKDKHDFTLLYNDNEFLKETDDKFVITDTSNNFKASVEAIKELKNKIKINADKIIKEYFPKDQYTFIKVGVSTDGTKSSDGNIKEVISMLSVVYIKTVNDTEISGKGVRTRIYFKPSGKIIGIKLSNLKSIKNPNLINDPERINNEIKKIRNYLLKTYNDSKNIYVKYVLLRKNDKLIPSYGILLIPNKAEKKILRYMPIIKFTGTNVINEFINPKTEDGIGDLK